jgi:uncharacterized protein YkwD
MHHRRAITIVAICLAVCLFGNSAATATTNETLSAYLINHYDRAPSNLRALALSSSLSSLARSHSYAMARAGRLYHTANLGSLVRGWTYLGENVGVGANLRTLNQAFMNSPAHRANILCRCFRLLGAGVVRDARGYYWVTHIFFS